MKHSLTRFEFDILAVGQAELIAKATTYLKAENWEMVAFCAARLHSQAVKMRDAEIVQQETTP